MIKLPPRLYGGVRFIDWPSYANVDLLDRGCMGLIDMMHQNGILVDKGHFAGLQTQLEARKQEFLEEAQALVGSQAPGLKLSSPPQVAKVLYEVLGLVPPGKPKRTKDGLYSTDDDVLSSMTKLHPFVETVINFREVNTLLNNFVRPIPRMVQADGRLRTIFKNTRTATGRLSSGDRSQGLVNLQNIPTRGEWGKLIRNGFVCGKGNVLVSLDLSQIEMRLAAHMAKYFFGDSNMADIFWSGWDIHTRTACAMFKLAIDRIEDLQRKVEEEERTKAKILTPEEKAEWANFKRNQRAPAKNLGFGVLFGLTAEGLQRNILAEGGAYFTVEECQEYIDKWFAAYPGIKRWMQMQYDRIRQYGMCWDLFGRTVLKPAARSVLQDKVSEAEREAGNMPIQGTAQGLIKLAMAEITPVVLYFQSFPSETCLPLIQIHDELVFEVSRPIAEELSGMGREIMRQSDRGQLTVPIDSSADMAERWGEAK